MADIPTKGTKEETKLFHEVNSHYKTAREDLEQRIYRKNGFNDADRMFSSYLDEKSWPYRSTMFDPRPYTVILEKSARLIGSKPKGRLVPREGGDQVGAMINNEVLSFQWDDNSRLGEPMLQKWINMDQNARKYGASFGLVKWRYDMRSSKGKRKTFYDGPDFVVCNPRDVLANPSYNTIQKWFQYREYVTLEELENVNDSARTKPVYKNLDALKEAMTMESQARTSSRREIIYVNENKAIRGLNDYLGTDETNKTIELITEYRPDRWITFAPKYGVIVRDIDSPYDHGEIPVVMLRYYPLGDDLYGLNEYEPVSKMIRGVNALFSQYIDNITVDLYPPLMVNPTAVRMHTLDFSPEAKWLMNNPGVDVKRLETSTAATNNFQAAYTLLVSSLLNAWGESSQGMSNIDPFGGDKTATEVKDTAFTRNVRDNMNQIFLSESLKKQTMFWHSLNQQFMFAGASTKAKIVRIVGKDAIDFFNQIGMSEISPTDKESEAVASGGMGLDQVLPGPKFPVNVEGMEVPKFQPDQYGGGGNLIVEPGDLMGNYDYIPDIETMRAPSNADMESKLTSLIAAITNPAIAQGLASEGVKPKYKDIMVRAFEATKVIKDAESLFEDAPQAQPTNGTNPANAGGVAGIAPSQPNQGNDLEQGVVGGNGPVSPIQNQPLMG
jgi:hypothetical protein